MMKQNTVKLLKRRLSERRKGGKKEESARELQGSCWVEGEYWRLL